MASIADDTIGGVNTFFDGQKAVPGECSATLVQFDDVIDTVFNGVKITDVPPLTKHTYKPRNNTALYDAVGTTINRVGDWLKGLPEDQRPGKVIFAIVTDGFENSSRKFDQAGVFDMIKLQRETYKWEFVFIGANQDALAAGAGIGIPIANSINYAATPHGTHAVYASMGSNVRSLRMCASADMSWSDDQRKDQEKEGAQKSKKTGTIK